MNVRRPVARFVAIGMSGLALLTVAVTISQRAEHPHWSIVDTLPLIGEHLASALIVAGIMGITYEWLVHREALTGFQELLKAQQTIVTDALDKQYERFQKLAMAAQASHADGFFALLSDIAMNRTKIPTIYRPARAGEDNEFVFSTHHEFFRNLIGNPDERKLTSNALRGWIDSKNHINLRFLGSDFIGMLQLDELVPDLREIFNRDKSSWPDLTKAEQSCLLNYAWAISRCERPTMYRLLSYFLRYENDDEIKKWILHVPLQMHDEDLREMIKEYLEVCGPTISAKLLPYLKTAIAALHKNDIDMTEIVDKYAGIFENAKLLEALRKEMNAAPFGGKKSLLSKLLNH